MASVLYYAREGYYRHVQTVVTELLKTYGSDPALLFWKAYGIIMEDRTSEGIRELESIADKRDMVLCSSMLLIHAHKKCKTVDREAIQQLETKIRSERTSCGEKSLYYAGMLLWLTGKHDKAREYISRMLKMAPTSKEGLTLQGWIDLTCNRDAFVKKSVKYFDEVLAGTEQPKPLDAMLGKARYYLSRHNFSHALDLLNQAVASYPGSVPALLDKMKVQLALQDWEQAVETAQRCLLAPAQDQGGVEATSLLALELLAKEGSREEAANRLADLLALIDRFEPKNHALYYEMSLPCARMAGGNNLVLQQTTTFLERAISLAPLNPTYVTELAYQLLLRSQVKEALQTYKKAFNLDETSVTALAGIIHCQILEGQLGEAEQQLDFLREVQVSIGRQANLLFLTALLAHKKGQPHGDVMKSLDEVVEVHFGGIKGCPMSPKYFFYLNPAFLLDVTLLLLNYAPNEPTSSSSQAAPILLKAAAILDPLTKSVPGMMEALYLMSRVKFLSGQTETAHQLLQRCLDRAPNSTPSLLMMAQINLHQGNPKLSMQSLEQALSRHFEVQSYPLYHLVRARVMRAQENMEQAMVSLKTAMSLLASSSSKKQAPSLATSSSSPPLLPPLTLGEKLDVYLELASAYTKMGQQVDAAKVMQDAMTEFKGSAEEVRVQIANADLLLVGGKVEEALEVLKGVTEEKPYYIQAQEKIANIHLTHHKDKVMYLSCYKQLASRLPGSTTSLLLGEAYMNVGEVDLALEIYEAGLKQNPGDAILATKIGQALVNTHNYNKAITYYEAALKEESQRFLRCDLVELYIKLRQYEKAEKTLVAAIGHLSQESELSQLMENTKYLLLLAKVYQKSSQQTQTIQTLIKAREVQSRVLKRVGLEQPDAVQAQKQLAASISCQMAEHAAGTREYDEAVRFYREALLHNDNHSKARLALAHLHLSRGELEACEHECVTLLRLDPSNEEAIVMKADLLFRKGEYTLAIQHYQELLSKKPKHFVALSGLIELMRRAGQLEDAQAYIERAETACARSAYEPGLNYCKGLLKWYQNDPNAALHLFNHARKDSEWGEQALFNMIQICLNPDDETLGGEAFKGMEDETEVAQDKGDAEQVAVRTAEKLLKELHPRSPASALKVRVLENYALLASKSKQNLEKALAGFLELANTEQNSVPVLLGVATAHMILKQTPKARNHLKRISKVTWDPQNGEEFEKSWLLLADTYIQAGKYDMAIELLRKCLQYNKSCSKAWEYLGFITEREQAYKDAAVNYENAWKYSSCSNPGIGYKLAFNYLKAKRYVDAIDVCHKVLESHPNYPKIRKEIMDKARQSIRS